MAALMRLGPPGRPMLDTNILQVLYDEGEYIYDGFWAEDRAEPDEELIALRQVMEQARRQQFQLVTSPISAVEVLNIQSIQEKREKLSWFLEMQDYWTFELDGSGDRKASGGTVQHRFKLGTAFQHLEAELMRIVDLRRDPMDRLLVVHTRMANCDVLLTRDRNSLWKHREALAGLGIRVVVPSEYLDMIEPWAGL